jgi:hypothetical protein
MNATNPSEPITSPTEAPPVDPGGVPAVSGAGGGYFTKIAHDDVVKIERQYSAHASVLLHLFFHLLTEAFRQRSLFFVLADATLARRMGMSRATIIRAKRALMDCGLIKFKNVKSRGVAWKNEPTHWTLLPSVSPLSGGVSTDEQGGVHLNTGGCSRKGVSASNRKKETLGPYGPQRSLSEDARKGKDGVAGGLESPATVLPSRKNWKDELFP